MRPEISQSRKINRTICIGLGGTGRDVLMRIRRLIVERHGDFKELPVISFVHIDTDKASSNVTGLRTGNTYQGVDLRFSDAEKVAATMTRAEVDNMTRELSRNATNYDGSPGVYSNISSWFPPQLLNNLKAIDEGAQAIRPVGRLAFFHNYRKVKAAIELADQRTRGHEAFGIRNNWSVDNKLNVFLVGSLCGGTGSGIFLDIAYCLRQMYGNDGAQIAAYLVMSPELYGNTSDQYANTYAALKELNYYATTGTVFQADYDLQNLESINESRPPFEYVYLVSNRTRDNYKILEKSKLCNVIAHKITLDFAGELAPALSANRDNYLRPMIPTDLHPRPNSQRYLTFGLAEIYFPRDIAVQVSLNRIKIKLVDFWMQGEGQSADPKKLLASFLDRWFDRGDDSNGFANKLRKATTDGAKTFDTSLSSWKNRLENDVAEIQNRDERQEVVAQLGREIRSEFRKVQPGESTSSRGLWLTNLQTEKEQIVTEYLKDIDLYLYQLLNPNHLDFSLSNSRIWLEALTTELNKSYRQLEDRINSQKSLHSWEAVERKWKEAQQTIEDIETKKSLFPRNKQKTDQVRDEAKRIIGQISKLIKENYESSLLREALSIVKSLQNKVSELTTRASAFNNLLSNVKDYYLKEEDHLKLRDVDDMSGEAIFADADSDTCYQDLLPERDRVAQLALISSKITEKIGLEESLASCLGQNVIDEEHLRAEIKLIVERIFGSRSSSTVQSAVKRFLESYPPRLRTNRLEQIIRESEPLLPLDTKDPYFRDDSEKTKKIISFKDTDKPEINQFKNILDKDLGVLDSSSLRPIQAEDEIIFVNEYGAFPLRIIQGLGKMREHYQRHQTYDSFLHNDYRIEFTDIIPPDGWEIKKLQDIFYPALAFELLPYDPKTRKYEFRYHVDDYRDRYETVHLSYVWDKALEQLSSRQDMATALDSKLTEAIADLTINPQRWQEYYLPKLNQFETRVKNLPKEDPNYPYIKTVIGVEATADSPRQEGIINRFWKKMQDVVRAEMAKQQHQEQTQPQIADTNNRQPERLIAANAAVSNDQNNSPAQTIQPDINEVIDAETMTSADLSTNPRKRLSLEDLNQLERLDNLLEKGRITEEEYQNFKQDIFNH